MNCYKWKEKGIIPNTQLKLQEVENYWKIKKEKQEQQIKTVINMVDMTPSIK